MENFKNILPLIPPSSFHSILMSFTFVSKAGARMSQEEARKEGRREEREKGKMLCTRFFFIAPSSVEG